MGSLSREQVTLKYFRQKNVSTVVLLFLHFDLKLLHFDLKLHPLQTLTCNLIKLFRKDRNDANFVIIVSVFKKP